MLGSDIHVLDRQFFSNFESIMFTPLFAGLLIVRLLILSDGAYGKKEISFDAKADQNQKIIIVSENSSNIISVLNIPTAVSSVFFQVHSHIHNITLSEAEEISLHTSVTGRNVGLLYRLHVWESEAHMWLFNQNQKKFSVLIIISYLDSNDAVPGGCNMEFPTEIAPYMNLRSYAGKIYLEYQHANIGVFREESLPVCGYSLPYFTYDVYVSYLNENDFGENEYFNIIKLMSNISLIKTSSKKVMSYSRHPDTRFSFLMYPNVGVVYNVIAKYTVNGLMKESFYVPAATYGCGNSDFTEHGCNFSYSFGGKAFLFLLSMYGFITAFFGHSFYNSTMFFFGFLATFFIILIILGRFSSLSISILLKICGVCGVIGGIIWFVLSISIRSETISLLLVGFVLGFLVAATIMYTPLGNYEINLNDKNYWLILATGSLCVTLVLISFPTTLSITGSSVVGSYVMLLFYDDFIGTRLSYIILNIVKRAISESLEFASNDLPFQIKDGIICFAWVVLSTVAAVKQSRSLRSSSNNTICLCKSRSANANVAYSSESNPSQTLCGNNDQVFYNTFQK